MARESSLSLRQGRGRGPLPPAAPPRTSRFGTPFELSRVQWVRPEVVVEVDYLTWTLNNLLRQVAYVGLREDKPAREVLRPVPHTKTRG